MLKAALILLGIVLATDLSAAQSQRLTPGDAEIRQLRQAQTNRAQQPAAADPRGTEQAPVVVGVLPTVKTAAEADQETKDRDEKAANDRRLADYAGALDVLTAVLAAIAVLQLFVFGYQARQMRRTVDAFVEGERPHVYPGEPGPQLIPPGRSIPPEGFIPSVCFFFLNYGKSAAIVRDIRVQLDFEAAFPKQPTFTHATRILGEGVLRGDGAQSHRNTVTLDRNITAEELAGEASGEKAFILFGWIKYEDFFGSIHTRGSPFISSTVTRLPPIRREGLQLHTHSKEHRICSAGIGGGDGLPKPAVIVTTPSAPSGFEGIPGGIIQVKRNSDTWAPWLARIPAPAGA
jgi:hypothetical protein